MNKVKLTIYENGYAHPVGEYWSGRAYSRYNINITWCTWRTGKIVKRATQQITIHDYKDNKLIICYPHGCSKLQFIQETTQSIYY